MKEVIFMSALCNRGIFGARQVLRIQMNKITPNKLQPRKIFDDIKLLELASSIQNFGLLQPITVRKMQDTYEIVMGERRYKACEMLGHTYIDALVLPISGPQSGVLALVENLQRENLHFIEEAEAYQVLVTSEMSQDALAKKLGKSSSAIANKIRLTKLTPEQKNLLMQSDLTERHARAVLTLRDEHMRTELLLKAIEKRLSVRQLEILVIEKAQENSALLSRHIISLARDHRLYLNAIKDIVEQMKKTGMHAKLNTKEKEDSIEVTILFPKS